MIDYTSAERPIGSSGAPDSAGELLAAHKSRPTWAEINLDNLVHNLLVVKQTIGPDVAVMSAIKADAYGHGAVGCSKALEQAGIEWFGVALPEEGERLREAGIARPILCLGGFWEGQEDLVLAQSLTPSIFRLDLLERLDRAAARFGCVADYHLKVDTGMGRLGVPVADLATFLDAAATLQNVRLDGIMTHMASADEPSLLDYTESQLSVFEEVKDLVKARGHHPRWVHAANSAATLAFRASRGNIVRLGGLLYGIWRDTVDPLFSSMDLRPVMSVRSAIMLVKTYPPGSRIGYGCTYTTARESLIATVPIGYSDGLRRSLSNIGHVLVKGQPAPIVGRVSMDLTNIDVTDISGVRAGDEVVILGSQEPATITAEDIAAACGGISYEVTCGLSERVPRIYVSNM
jgi:alanine racemase